MSMSWSCANTHLADKTAAALLGARRRQKVLKVLRKGELVRRSCASASLSGSSLSMTSFWLSKPGRRVRPLVEKPALGWKKRRAVRRFIVDSRMLANLVSASSTDVKVSRSARASRAPKTSTFNAFKLFIPRRRLEEVDNAHERVDGGKERRDGDLGKQDDCELRLC